MSKAKPILVFTRGLPGSGKTTYARNWVARNPGGRARVNRDDFREMLHDGYFEKGKTEQAILTACDASISALLKKGISVINDDTNLPQRRARELRRLADLHGADWEVVDLTSVSLEECIARDKQRGTKVGIKPITDMHERFIKGVGLPLPLPLEDTSTGADRVPYVPNRNLPAAILVDIDGTVALKGNRGQFEEDKIHLDRPNVPVVEAIKNYWSLGYNIVFASGRGSGCYWETRKWLDENVTPHYDALLMRPQGDMRKDFIVKYELFDQFIRDQWDIRIVFDDRNQVVDMWRSIGLTVFQVADGNF